MTGCREISYVARALTSEHNRSKNSAYEDVSVIYLKAAEKSSAERDLQIFANKHFSCFATFILLKER